ncbi:hypothetical protein V5735_21705 (plasmid) [Haladaptatus sp. SPP-AMP-3]|uniref:hypothetical protein n=1 Tax=Haladaptatus sp. SPP-AMP-3 TaxID=3121295 RepID=UPI003C2C1436
MRRAYHVARADFRQRTRSRKLVVVLAVIAYIGYLVNVGQIKLAYQITDGETVVAAYHGESTAAYIGLKAGLTGAAVLLLGGFYLMKNALERDRTFDIAPLVASAPVSDRTYLLGKWLSNVALGCVIVVTLGVSTVVNHAVSGIGPTKPVPLLLPLVVLALPVGALVGAVALLFETVETLDGTLGNVGYFLLVPMVLATTLSSVNGRLPAKIPAWTKGIDVMGYLTVYQLTSNALVRRVSMYDGGLPSVGMLEAQRTFYWSGGAWPRWVLPQRVGVVATAVVIVLVSAVSFDRFGSNGSDRSPRFRVPSLRFGLLSRVGVPSIRRGVRTRLPTLPTVGRSGDAKTERTTRQGFDPALTPVTNRDAGGFGRLVVMELRLALRGHPWWWYVGGVALVAAPLSLLTTGASTATVETFRRTVLPFAFVWPLFVWSAIGVRTVHHRLTALVLSSRYPIRQLVAEWVAGVVLAMALGSGAVVLFAVTGQTGILLGYASAVLFAPSLAVAAGIWSRSSTLFELSYLLLWYVGVLNGAPPIDFVGTTAESVDMGVPLVFIGLGIALFGTALVRRKREVE